MTAPEPLTKTDIKQQILELQRLAVPGSRDDYELLFVKRLREADFTDEQIVTILTIMGGLCHYCLDYDEEHGPCCCKWDE